MTAVYPESGNRIEAPLPGLAPVFHIARRRALLMRLSVAGYIAAKFVSAFHSGALFIMQSTDRKDIGQKTLLAAGLLAASLFVLVSMAANLEFGLSIAATPFDRIIYGALSLGADPMLPLGE